MAAELHGRSAFTCSHPQVLVIEDDHGYGDRRYPDRIILAGANEVLIKPLEPDVLIATARRLLSKEAAAVKRG
jgi:hypothetical protein